MKNKTTKLVITFICLLTLLLAYYAYLSNKDRNTKEEASMTPVQEALNRDMKNDYPATPKEVLKYYNVLLKCFYNEDSTEEQIDALGQRARELYDEELLEANELGTYLIRLHTEVADYKDKNRRIASAAVSASTNVDFFEEDGFEFARIMCVYNIMEGDTSNPTRIMYLLRKDEDRHWKIYGWEDAANLKSARENETAETVE